MEVGRRCWNMVRRLDDRRTREQDWSTTLNPTVQHAWRPRDLHLSALTSQPLPVSYPLSASPSCTVCNSVAPCAQPDCVFLDLVDILQSSRRFKRCSITYRLSQRLSRMSFPRSFIRTVTVRNHAVATLSSIINGPCLLSSVDLCLIACSLDATWHPLQPLRALFHTYHPSPPQ